MRKLLPIILQFFWFAALGQVSVDPAFPTADEEITITYDATRGASGLVNATSVIMHAGVVLEGPNGTSWQYVQGTWGDPASVGKMTSLGNNQWEIKITPRTYFGVPAGMRIYRIGMVFRSAGPCGGFGGNSSDCKTGRTTSNSDIFIDIAEAGQFEARFSQPATYPVFVNTGEILSLKVDASVESDITLKVNNQTVASGTGTTLSYNYPVVETSGTHTVSFTATSNSQTVEKSISFVVRTSTATESRPEGIVDGINYTDDPTEAVLSLLAPGKTSCYVVGDFTNWEVRTEFKMKKDGEHFWIRLEGLTAGEEYAFFYLIDETLRIADPFTDKILDPLDVYIPESIYPGIKAYPQQARNAFEYNGPLSVLQTNQQSYQWSVPDFQKPAKEKLVIYELLIRDFFAANDRSYQNLIDTISYFKRLGVNAIELMPIMEFNGNESWGYNPTFMFAPDKAYGSKEHLKMFIDRCHQEGIAVILDIALNHQDAPNPMVLLDYNFATNQPNPTNKWFNVSAKHPYNVFNDLNHESLYTQSYVDTINYYWLNEFKVDGFRFDLSKGFTQNAKCNGSTSDENCFAERDQSRIDILKRMSDEIRKHTPDAILILEHFANNSEEIELAEHGFLIWGNATGAYSNLAKGNGADISSVYYKTRNWIEPNLVSYMESHDEERVMFESLEYGKSSGAYSIKNLNTALDRMKATSLLFYPIPGPKMLWQFGELGYDQSIRRCEDGSLGDCRLTPKPVLWEYTQDPARAQLFSFVSNLIKLKKTYDVFQTGDATFQNSGLIRQITLKNTPYNSSPTSTDDMNVQIVANFDVTSKVVNVNFAHPGTWYDYYNSNQPVTVVGSTVTMTFQPGQYKMFTDVRLGDSPVTSIEEEFQVRAIYPNPGTGLYKVDNLRDIRVYDIHGKLVPSIATEESLDIRTLPSGLYIVRARQFNRDVYQKIIKH